MIDWDAGPVDEVELAAGRGGVVGIDHADYDGGEDHNQAKCYDRTEVEHRSQHPSAVLVNLQPLDIVVCETDAGGCEDDEQPDT